MVWSWLADRAKRSGRGPAEGGSDSRRTEIVGVTGDPLHDSASGGTGLYEFRTAEGVPVYLHDTTLISIELRPVDRRLRLQFDYSDPQWTPPEAARTPVVVMEFEAVTIREWIPDPDVDDEVPAEVNGQVEDFAHVNGDEFRLTTYQSEIGFTAEKLTVTLMARQF